MSLKTFIGSGSTGIIGVFNTIIVPSIFALAFLVFVYGVVKYFLLVGTDESRAEGRQFVLWGLLGMALLLSVWGVVNMLLSTLGVAPT
jgi:hypothetical protein